MHSLNKLLILFSFFSKVCLRKVNDTASRVVGQAFFNVIQIPCFEFVPREQCVEPYLYVWCKNYSTVIVAEAQQPVLYDYGGEVIDGPATQRPASTSAAPGRELTTSGTQARPSGSPPKRRKGKGKGRKGRKGKGSKATKGVGSAKSLDAQGLAKGAFPGQKSSTAEEKTFNAILMSCAGSKYRTKTGGTVWEAPSLHSLATSPSHRERKRKGRRKHLMKAEAQSNVLGGRAIGKSVPTASLLLTNPLTPRW
ncbi:protein PROCA1 [Sphaerodactylus townsendi]|uniref:protein PROCA1 n=1 Tax=Sphaerodactylus townsendi TaxID=933632 RepID=UPI0020269FDF|nr:protein PROCA1 [Sphaerodactylus townsendi]